MLKKTFFTGLLAGTVILGAGAVSAAEEARMNNMENKFVTLTGTASQVSGEEFLLTYDNNKKVIIDLERWGDVNAPDVVANGGRVTVSGRIEDNLFELPEIDAQTIHALDAGRRFEYSSADSRVIRREVKYSSRTEPMNQADANTLTGTVADFNGLNFVLLTDNGIVSVDTAGLPYNPADDDYSPALEKGDKVTLRARSAGAGPYDIVASEVVSITKSYGGKAMKQTLNPDKEPVGQTAENLSPAQRRALND